MSNEFNIKNLETELSSLINEFINHEHFKYNPRNCFERIISKTLVNINNKKSPLSSLAIITNTSFNDRNTLRISPLEKVNTRYIESALLSECNQGIGEKIEKDNNTFIVYLPNVITQTHIDNVVKVLFKPVVDTYLHVKLKEVRNKYHDLIKSMQSKQRDLFNKYREQIDVESQKYVKKINDAIASIEKKYNIKI